MIEIEKYCEKILLTKEQLFSESKITEIVTARWVYWYYLRYKKNMPFYQIGRIFGRNHSTVIHGINKVSELIDINDKYILIFINSLK